MKPCKDPIKDLLHLTVMERGLQYKTASGQLGVPGRREIAS